MGSVPKVPSYIKSSYLAFLLLFCSVGHWNSFASIKRASYQTTETCGTLPPSPFLASPVSSVKDVNVFLPFKYRWILQLGSEYWFWKHGLNVFKIDWQASINLSPFRKPDLPWNSIVMKAKVRWNLVRPVLWSGWTWMSAWHYNYIN